MTNNIPYVSSPLMEKVCKIGMRKYLCKFKEIGMVMLQHRKEVYERHGHEVASDKIDFVLFDNYMNKIGVVKRDEVKKYQSKKSQHD